MPAKYVRPYGAFDARIAVGRIGGVEFVAAADPTDPGIVADRIVDREGIIARHAEDIGDSEVVQAGENILNDGLGHDWSLIFNPCPALS
jgi:hypothetical protein